MNLTADFHTHTTFSHGKGSILDNALIAKEKGLKQIAITDHGYGHRMYGINHKKVPYMKELCRRAEEQTGVKVLFGVEANILGVSGKTDMKTSDMEYMDIYLAGVHKFITYERLREWYLLLYKNYAARHFQKPSKELIDRNTKVYINAIKSNPIDILTHPNYHIVADVYEVAKCCADYGTLFEIDARKEHLTDDEWEKVLKTGVKFVIDSDAHSPKNIGELGMVEELIKRVKIPEDRILNINGKLPENLRFKAFKEKM
jgi:putative hydrolase